MSTIERLFNTEFTIKRSEWSVEVIDGVDIDQSEEVEIAVFMGHIQQMSAELIATLALTYSKPHLIWCPVDTDIKEGDVITSEIGDYTIRAVQFNNTGNNPHLEVFAEYIGEAVDGSTS